MSTSTIQSRRARGRTRGCAGDAGRSSEPARLFDAVEDTAAPVKDAAAPLGGEPTLEMLISGVWEGLAAHLAVACPLCGGTMTAVLGAHAHPVGGRCGDCGSTLA